MARDYPENRSKCHPRPLWKAEQLLKELGLTRHSEEVQPWLDINVRGFYVAAVDKMIKYFQGTLESKVMEALKVMDPKFWRLGKGDMLSRAHWEWGESAKNWITTLAHTFFHVFLKVRRGSFFLNFSIWWLLPLQNHSFSYKSTLKITKSCFLLF